MLWMILLLIISCGPSVDVEVIPKDPTTTTPIVTNPPINGEVTWAVLQPIIEKDCNQSGCHAGASFTAGEQAFLNSRSKARVANGSMPPKYSDRYEKWDNEKKDLLLSFFEKAGK